MRIVADDRPHAASGVAAGMLAPATEVATTELGLLQLNLASLERYDSYIGELEADTGHDLGLRRTATLSVGLDGDDAARLADFAQVLADCGLTAELCTARQARKLAPLLAPTIRSALVVPGDWAIDPRLLWAALRADLARREIEWIDGTVTGIVTEDGRCRGVTLAESPNVERTATPPVGRTTTPPVERTTTPPVERSRDAILTAEVVVWCPGAWAAEVPLPFDLPVRPVKGQVVRLRAGRLPLPEQTLRAFVHGTEVYLVPRHSGEIAIGATSEDRGFEGTATGGGVYELLRDARAVLPITAEYEFAEVSVGFRPATPTHAPLLGPSPLPGLVLATGHHRNGVLLTPITAELIAGLVVDGDWPELGRAFNPYEEKP